jgi:acyl-CoA dehydrogenase
MVMDAARRATPAATCPPRPACCKLFASEMCGRVADRAVQIFGGAGYMAEYGIERFYRDVRLFRLYEGTTQIQQMVIARGT